MCTTKMYNPSHSSQLLICTKKNVYYHIKEIDQKDIVLMNEHKKIISSEVEMEMLQRSIHGMNEYIDEVTNLA